MEKVHSSNQPPSSQEWEGMKRNTQLDGVANDAGNESGVSDTAGRGAVAKAYAAPSGNTGINGTASVDNLSAQWKNPRVKVGISEFEASEFK